MNCKCTLIHTARGPVPAPFIPGGYSGLSDDAAREHIRDAKRASRNDRKCEFHLRKRVEADLARYEQGEQIQNPVQLVQLLALKGVSINAFADVFYAPPYRRDAWEELGRLLQLALS